MKKWGVLSILAASMFIIVIDTTIMNVSISNLVEDLNTTVGGIQSAIALYALVMASFMLTGGKLADYIGKKRTFVLGLILFGIGTSIASVSQTLGMLIIGWSVIEGLGSALMMPNIQTILRDNYKANDRALAYGIIGAVGAVGAALGPILGGFLTTFFSWRWAFRLEVLIVVIVLVFSKLIAKDVKHRSLKFFDIPGTILSIVGLGSVVLAVLSSETYGWWLAKKPFEIGGLTFEFFGLSVTPVLMGVGLLIIILLFQRESNLVKKGKDYLFSPKTLSNPGYLPSVNTRFLQMGISAGFLFVFPLFLQLTFNYSAVKTGVALLPFSFATLIFAVGGARFSHKYSAKKLIRLGFLFALIGLLGMVISINSVELNSGVAVSSITVGAGVGLVAAQLVNLALSCVKESEVSEASGLTGTFEQLGNSIGVALIGTILVATLARGISTDIIASSVFSVEEKNAIEATLKDGVETVSDDALEQYLAEGGVSIEKANEIVKINSDNRLIAFKSTLLFMSFLALVSLVTSRNLPNKKLG